MDAAKKDPTPDAVFWDLFPPGHAVRESQQALGEAQGEPANAVDDETIARDLSEVMWVEAEEEMARRLVQKKSLDEVLFEEKF